MTKPEEQALRLASGQRDGAEGGLSSRAIHSITEHRLEGILWPLVESGEIAISDDALASLATLGLSWRRRSRQLLEAAQSITHLLGDEGLEVAVFKGIAAERRWYSGPGARPAFDLDLWLSPWQLDRAREVVELVHPRHPLAGDVTDLVSDRRLRSVDLSWQGIPVDLHFDPFKFGVWHQDLDSVWANTEVRDDGIRVMGSAAELLVAILHLNKDRFSRLIGFVDVVRGATQPGVAEASWELAKAIGVTVPVACSAQVVRETLGAEIPIPEPPPGWKTRMWRRLWPEGSRLLGNEGYSMMRKRQDWIPFLCDDRLPEALRHLRHVLFPPKALLEYSHPEVAGTPYPIGLVKARIGRSS